MPDPEPFDFSSHSASDVAKKPSKLGKVLLAVTGVTFGLVVAVTTPFVIPALRRVCLPYIPATPSQVTNVLKLLEGHSGRLVDLGSGDGRIVIEAAKRGFVSEGLELNPWLVWYSRLRSLQQGVSPHTRFYTQDLWKADLSRYDHVVVFGVDSMMPELEQKLRTELCRTGQVIACRFPFPAAQPARTEGQGLDTVWLYTTKSFK